MEAALSTAIVVVVVVVVVALAVTLLMRNRARSPQRLAQLVADAEMSLAQCRAWKATVQQELAAASTAGHWIPREHREAWLAARPTPTREVERLARLKPAGEEARDVLEFLAHDLSSVVATANDRIRADELARHRPFFDTIEKQPLTSEQASAVVTFDNRVQVIAAAGSGKTSVMVARAAYSILRGFVPAERILLLAFNKDAATELQHRVEARLGAAGIDASGVKASTFHSFGLTVIGQATGEKPRLAAWLDGGRDIKAVTDIVDELRDSSPSFRYQWDLYRLLFARMADEPGAGEPDADDVDAKHSAYRTFNGETVKSQGERLIADYLFLNGVTYEYERPYSYKVADAEHSQYRPDFYYPDVDVWHEHWALDRNGNPPRAFHDYAASMAWKKAVHHEQGTALIQSTWAAILDGSGIAPLADDLKAHGLTLDWNPDRPMTGATPVKHEDLARLMRSFLTHVKSNSLSRQELDRRLESAPPAVQRFRAGVFLYLFWAIHEQWQRRLAVDNSIDFEDMLVRAAEYLESGATDPGYDLVLVDEFQDASQARARLTKALVDQRGRYLLAVGDDWQSINRFAGADLTVMTTFSSLFGEGPKLRLQMTFRSPQSICDTASRFVAKNPAQISKSVRSAQSDYGPSTLLVRVKQASEVRVALASVLGDLAGRVRSGSVAPGPSGSVEVDVLGRYRFDRDLLPSNLPPELNVHFRTVHSAKGLETDYVVLPNMLSGTYGFPSEVVDDPVLSLAMAAPDPFPHAEERRLFYVALTRARRQVTLIGVRGRESVFVTELLKDGRLELSPLSTVRPSVPCPACRQGALDVKYRRRDGHPFWACSRRSECGYTQSLAP